MKYTEELWTLHLDMSLGKEVWKVKQYEVAVNIKYSLTFRIQSYLILFISRMTRLVVWREAVRLHLTAKTEFSISSKHVDCVSWWCFWHK